MPPSEPLPDLSTEPTVDGTESVPASQGQHPSSSSHGQRQSTTLRARPVTGLLAWQSTVGYISQHHLPDARLTMRIVPQDRHLLWSATLAWGHHRETVLNRATLAAALADLWWVVGQYVVIFRSEGDQVLSPAHYEQAEWLDIPTQEIFQRLLWMTMTAFQTRWHLVVLYQPVEATQRRIQMRLLVRPPRAAQEDEQAAHYDVVVGAWGASLMEACRTLYRNAAPHFLMQTTRTQEMRAVKPDDNNLTLDTD